MASRSALALLLLLVGCKATAPQPTLHELVIAPRVVSERAPVLVLVHGYGANERDLAALAPQLDGRFSIHSVRALNEFAPGRYGWFPLGPTPDAEAARKALSDFIKQLRVDPKYDPSRVYLMGFSQGAMLGLLLARTEPELLAGVVAVGGRTLQHPLPTKPGRTPRVLILHGRRDQRVGWANAPESQRVLEEAGREVELQSYDAGHQLDAAMKADLVRWLSARLDETEAPPGG